MFGIELLEQSEKVQEECVKLQAFVDPESNFIHITSDIFLKEKRVREEDVEDEQSQKVIFEVEGSESLHHLYHSIWYYLVHKAALNMWHGFRTVLKHHSHRKRNKNVIASLSLDPVQIPGR
jgi:hypothetical protein